MNDTTLHTIEQVEAFLAVASVVEFHFETTTAGYTWIQATLVRFASPLPKTHKGIVRRYVQAVTVLPCPGGPPNPDTPADRAGTAAAGGGAPPFPAPLHGGGYSGVGQNR